jgi:transposase
MQWAPAPQQREQMVLFAKRLEDAIAPDHTVRMLDSILSSPQIRWSEWEAAYHGRLGQPPIHPSVLAKVLLYGLMTRLRASRALEEALQVRIDFQWLAQGRSIDHTTLSEFRRKHTTALKSLFVQVGLVAKELGMLQLERMAFDGTRTRANNRRSGTRTPDELRQMRAELQARFDELTAQAETEDTRDNERFALGSPHPLPSELADVQRRKEHIDQALGELNRLEQSGQTLPKRLPITDVESRLMPNKEGGFAPNFTPTATVDVASGLIVEATVLNVHNEDQHLFPAIDQVRQDFGLQSLPAEVLVDGLIGTGANLAEAEERGVTIYSPCKIPDPAQNPALRSDPTQPVAEADWDRLPTKQATVTTGGQKEKTTQLDKSAFVYDEARDCYWCPQGKPLTYRVTTNEPSGTGQRIRRRYQAEAETCASCPLRTRCLQGKAVARQINREQHEAHRERHVAKMATAAAQETYALRRHVGERPFAVIKHQFGVRQFLLRGLEKVQNEWHWATTAFNVKQIISWLSRAGPGGDLIVSTLTACE